VFVDKNQKLDGFDSRHYFNLWRLNTESLGGNRFAASNRKDIIIDLVNIFYDSNINIQEAESYRSQVVEVLTTKHGRRPQDYRKWVEKTELDFDLYLSETYLVRSSDSESGSAVVSSVSNSDLIPNNSSIVKWLTSKYNNNLTEEIVKQAHVVGSVINLLFLKEYFLDGN